MFDVTGMVNECEELCRKFTEMPEEFAKPILCMCMDTVAKKSGQTTVEMLDEIRPIAQAVQDEFGNKGIL